MRRYALAVVAVALLAGCGGYGGVPAAEAPPVNGDPITGTQVVAKVGLPKTIHIPKLGVTDAIVSVDVDANNAMEVPPIDKTGWWKRSVRPGEVGPSVVLSHVNFGGVKGAFSHLRELVAGDELSVTDDGGVVRRFEVVEKRTFKKSAFDENHDLLFDDTGTADLIAVTCGGTLVGRNYDSNVALRARLVTT